ncbi:rhodanese-like domain-containing protein 15, chloroplastic isoform X2 [Solanum stenotomum]|uniref:rhodanese-like domain-containing protein 15, chloroplastic isoform X2 n=1 Tax=Solanum stenotomum TaxID=172797 RepID=UPI0020D0CDF6|nr:rhodanese-like domain-containing protein 15, chloroplastic isoform X2 [Solanum stenotomum]
MRTISLHSTSFSLLEFHGTKNLAHSRINGSVSLIPMARSQFQPKKRRDIGTSNRNPSFSWMATVGEKVQNSTVPTSVPVRVALELLQAGHRYLDVRTAEEFSDGHAAGAINIPYMLRIGSGLIISNSIVLSFSEYSIITIFKFFNLFFYKCPLYFQVATMHYRSFSTIVTEFSKIEMVAVTN